MSMLSLYTHCQRPVYTEATSSYRDLKASKDKKKDVSLPPC